MTIPLALAAALEDRYRIERELGAGGMATVYLAQDLKHDRKVAIKVLRPELAAVIGAERFLREIKTIANLQHPHILGLIDSGEVNGTAFYVMPFVEGESLRDRLNREKQLPVSDAVRLATEVAAALDYAHRHGVIHRDIKPENILLHDGRALVADFGIALAVSSAGGSRMTETGMSLGTPHYMSPEQAMGEREITARSDVYALGAMTYEMLTGDPPFTGSTAQAIVAKVMTEKPASIRRLRDRVPEAVEDAVLTALEKLPADRFASAKDFAEALSGSTTAVLRPAARRGAARPWPWLGGGILLGAILAGLGLWLGAGRSEPEYPIRFAVTLPREVTMVGKFSNGTAMALSPDGRTLVFAGRGTDGIQRLYARGMNEALPHPLSGTEGAEQPTFSPDGIWLAFWADGRLQKVPIAGGSPETICNTPSPLGVTWSPDGSIVLGGTLGLLRVPAIGGEPERISQGDPPLQAFPVALSDGEHVVFGQWGQGGLESVRLAVASLKSGKITLLPVQGTAPLGVIAGYLMFTRPDRTLYAVRFDPDRAEVSGAPVAIASNILSVGGRGGVKAALSASGSLAYAADDARVTRLVLTSNGETTEALVDSARSFEFPRFSPDGRRVAVTVANDVRSDVWLYDIGAPTAVRFSSGGTVNERAEWTPDGQRVLFRSDAGGLSAIWWRPADLSGPATPLLQNPRIPYFEAVVTPDGKSLVFQQDTAGGDIRARPITGDTAEWTVTDTRFDENMARLSPDGHWVAYVTNDGGVSQVMVQAYPGPGIRAQVSVSGGSEPVWARDGRRLFYRGEGKFIAASISTASGFQVLSRSVLFDDDFITAPAPHANYDIAPDGRFLVVSGIGGAMQLVVVHNWVSELKQRMQPASR